MMLTEAALHSLIPLFFRALGMIALLPLGTGLGGFSRQLSLAAGAAVIFSLDLQQMAPLSGSVIVTELMVGIVMGLPAALVIDAARSLGELFDVGRGQTLGNLYDPVHAVSISHMSFLAEKLLLATMCVAGLFEILCGALVQSLSQLPLGALSTLQLSTLGYQMIQISISIAAGTFAAFLVMAALYSCIDLFVAFLGRAIGAGSLQVESMQCKTILGFVTLLLMLQIDLTETYLRLVRPRLELLPG